MKRIVSLLAVVTLLAAAPLAQAQNTQTAQTAAEAKAPWKEKDEFHQVMAETFHPMEEGNLEPIKKRSLELFEKAQAWASSPIPKDLDQDKVRTSLNTLARQTRELNAKINYSKTPVADAEIVEALTKAHDTFHEIVGLCKPGSHGHGHHGHDHSDPNHKH